MKKFFGILHYDEAQWGLLQLVILLAVIPVALIVLSRHPDTEPWVYILVIGVSAVIILFTFMGEVLPRLKSGYQSWLRDNQNKEG